MTVEFEVKGYKCLISDCDADLMEYTWHIIKPSSKKPRNTDYLRRVKWAHNKATGIYAHREIMSRMIERPLIRGEQVDHIDGNGLNNQRDNLRVATKTENMRNSKRRKNNTSGFKGVSKNGKHGYMAKIAMGKTQIYLGTFTTPEAASEAYIKAAKRLFGDFANGG